MSEDTRRPHDPGDPPCPEGRYAALKALPPLPAHRSPARETTRVGPVPEDVLERTLRELEPEIQDIVRVQLWSGMRPTEALTLTMDQVDDQWVYRPVDHKTRHLGLDRVIPIGPKARAVLQRRAAGQPTDAIVLTVRGKTLIHRQYWNKVAAACRRAGVPHWHPHQLKHNHHTLVRQRYGLEAAREVAGHSSVDTTALYAERNLEAARRIAEEIG